MAEEVKKSGFDFYLRFVKPLVINLPDPTDRVLAAAWVQKLRNNKSGNEELRINYIKLLLFVLQRKKLIGPFRENPNTSKDLEDFPANIQIIDVAKSLLQADEVDRRERLRGLIAGAGDDFPPYSIECSADLLEYAAAQNIPKFGVHAYYAISSSPITSWENVDVSYLPKGVTLDKGGEAGGINISGAASTPEIMNKSHMSVSDSKSKSRSRSPKQERGSPKSGDKGKSPKRIQTKAQSVAKSPLGSEAPVEDRSPPTWGSNLIEVTDPPDETAFNRSLTSGVNYAEFDMMIAETDLNASSSHDMQLVAADDQVGGEPEWFQSPTDKFVKQFNNISIRPGTAKSQDIIDEVNQSLSQSGRELSLSQAQDEVDTKYPHRRTDMPRTPPVFSKHPKIRKAGQDLQYSPQQFGITDEEEFGYGPSFIENQQFSPKQSSPTRPDLRHGRMMSSAFQEIEGDVSLQDHTPDDIFEEVEEAIRTPKNVQRKLKELLNEIEVMKETTPALGGVPVTTPKRSPSPSRKIPSPTYNLEDELALYTEKFPDLLDVDFLNDSDEKSAEKGTPTRSPKTASPQEIIESPRSRAARLRPESPPTPEKPDAEEFAYKTMTARKFLRPRKVGIMPTSSGKKIRVYTKPVKFYRPPAALNRIEESPEYKTSEDRYYDLYEQLIAEDKLPHGVPMSPPTISSVLNPALQLSPLFPSPTLDWAQDFTDESEDMYDSNDLYESPKRISPLKELAIPEQSIDTAPDIMENIQFNFDYNPIDLGASAATQDLYEGELYEPISPRTPPRLTNAEIGNILGSPIESPVRPPTPCRPQASPTPSPQFYEMENVLTPQEFQEVMAAHEYTDMHVSKDPERKLASQLRTPGGQHIPLPRHAPKPRLETIADKPMLEEILMQRDKENPLTPPAPLTPGVPWRRPLLQGNIRMDEMPEETQMKLMEPVPQRQLKEWEETVFEKVVEPEETDFFMKLFNEYHITNEELINPMVMDKQYFKEPRGRRGRDPMLLLAASPPRTPPPPPPPPMTDVQFNSREGFRRPEMRVKTPPQVVMRPEDIPESWAVTQNILEQAKIAKEQREWRERREIEGDLFSPCQGPNEDLLETGVPLVDESEFTFESPRRRATRLRPYSPPTPEKPTHEEFMANIKAAKKRKRPSKMTLGTTCGERVRHYTRPLRHYEPLAYLDRIDESPYVSPEVDWVQMKAQMIAEEQAEQAAQQVAQQVAQQEPECLGATPRLQQPERRRRGRTRMPDVDAVKPRKLKFTGKTDANEIEFFPEDSFVPQEDRVHYNKLLATLPDLPPQPMPDDLMGEFYEHTFAKTTSIMDKEVPTKHLQHQRRPLSPKRADIFFPQSPVAPRISPVKLQNMYADPLNQEMAMDFPEDIEGEIEPIPDPYAFMDKLPTRYQGFEEDIPQNIGTTHEGFTGSPIRPPQQPKGPCMPCTPSPAGAVSPSSPYGLDTFFETPPQAELFERHPDEDHELWMEYQPVDYFEADQYKMDTPPRPKSPPKHKTPSPRPKAPSPKSESPLPMFLSPERDEQMPYIKSPSPFKQAAPCNAPAYPQHKKVLTPTRPSPYKTSYTPPGLPPAFAAIEASPIKFPNLEPFNYLASPEYENANLNAGDLEDFDLSYASTASSPDQQASPMHLTATPPSKHLSPQLAHSPLPSPISMAQNVDNWDLDMTNDNFLDGTADGTYESPMDMYDSPVCSPAHSCNRTPPSPPQHLSYEDQFASPTVEEFQEMMASHEYTERHVSQDPRRKLATKVLRTTTGNKAFHLPRHAPRPTLQTIYDFDETPENMEPVQVHVAEIPQDVMWQSPEPLQSAAPVLPTMYDTSGFVCSPERDFQSNYIQMLPKRKEVRRNLFDEFGEDSEIQEDGVQNFTPPKLSAEAWFQSPPTPPSAPFSPAMLKRMQRTQYDGSAPYEEYPELVTPPSGTRRRMRTYTPPGPAGPSPIKPTREEMMQNIATCYAPPTPHSMGLQSHTGYIKQVPTRPAQEYYGQRMDRLEEIGEQYLTPPSGLKRHRKTYTPPGERSPAKPTRGEMMQNIATCYAPPTPHSMGLQSHTGYIKQVPTRPAQEYSSQRMDRLDEVGEQYLTPPSGLKRHRRTYTPQATPRASPRLSPDAVAQHRYTPSPLPSPHLWFKPTYTPPPHLRWSPLDITPSPPKHAAPPTCAASARPSVRRQLFADSTDLSLPQSPRTPARGRRPELPCYLQSPDESFATPTGPEMQQQSPDDMEFFSPEISPSRTYKYEQEIVCNVANAFADMQTGSILDTSDIQIAEGDEDMDFKWMG